MRITVALSKDEIVEAIAAHVRSLGYQPTGAASFQVSADHDAHDKPTGCYTITATQAVDVTRRGE